MGIGLIVAYAIGYLVQREQRGWRSKELWPRYGMMWKWPVTVKQANSKPSERDMKVVVDGEWLTALHKRAGRNGGWWAIGVGAWGGGITMTEAGTGSRSLD